MTDWENYTTLCSLKDNVSSVCRSVQTNAYSNFHRFLFHYPLDYYGESFIRDLCQTYSQIHFNPRINNIELLTDLNDTPPQLITSGMSSGTPISISGSFMTLGGGIVTANWRTPIEARAQSQRPLIADTSRLAGKFITKVKRKVRKVRK